MILMDLIIITTIPAVINPNNISSLENTSSTTNHPYDSAAVAGPISENQSKPDLAEFNDTPDSRNRSNIRFEDDRNHEFNLSLSVEFLNAPAKPILFEESPSYPKAHDYLVTMPNCSETKTFFNGTCFTVLQQLPCPLGQWLIEDESSEVGKCVENKCAGVPDTAFYNNKCVQVKSEEPCSPGMRTYIYKNGQVECDCKEGFIYDEKSGNCYEAYRQGPCQKARYFAIPSTKVQNRQKPKCTLNPCIFDGYFCNTANTSRCSVKRTRGSAVTIGQLPRNCVKLGSPCTRSGRGLYLIHPELNSPACIDDIMDVSRPDRVIGNVPTLKCAPGSRRDILGNCRAPTMIDFS